MTLEKETNVVQLALEKLIPQYQNQPNFTAFLTVLLNRYQGLENTIYDLFTKRSLADSEGVQLDKLGKMVGAITRTAGMDDETYRSIVIAKIAANNSSGLHNQIIGIIGLLGGEGICIVNKYPAGINLHYTGDNVLLTQEQIMETLINATTEIEIQLTKYDENSFGFDEDPTALPFDTGFWTL